MMSKNFVLIISLLSISFCLTNPSVADTGHQSDERLIQLSGMVTTADTSSPVPFASIMIKNEHRGTIANMEGFYTLVVREGDTIKYMAMGFRTEELVVPRGLEHRRYRHIQPLEEDTIMLEEHIVFPWPTEEQFKRAFLNLNLQDDMATIAEENLQREILRQIHASLRSDPGEAYTMEMRTVSSDMARRTGQLNYYMMPGTGTPVPTTLLSPGAWAEFIRAIQHGELSPE